MDIRTGEIMSEAEMERRKKEQPKLTAMFKTIPVVTREQMLRRPPRVLPNEPCPCGSQKKFKKCCYYVVDTPRPQVIKPTGIASKEIVS